MADQINPATIPWQQALINELINLNASLDNTATYLRLLTTGDKYPLDDTLQNADVRKATVEESKQTDVQIPRQIQELTGYPFPAVSIGGEHGGLPPITPALAASIQKLLTLVPPGAIPADVLVFVNAIIGGAAGGGSPALPGPGK